MAKGVPCRKDPSPERETKERLKSVDRWLGFLGAERKQHGEVASLVRNAVQLQPTTVGGDQGVGDIQTQAHALWEATAWLAAVKWGKDASLLF